MSICGASYPTARPTLRENGKNITQTGRFEKFYFGKTVVLTSSGGKIHLVKKQYRSESFLRLWYPLDFADWHSDKFAEPSTFLEQASGANLMGRGGTRTLPGGPFFNRDLWIPDTSRERAMARHLEADKNLSTTCLFMSFRYR